MIGLRRITSHTRIASTSSLMKSMKSCSMSTAILFHDVVATVDGNQVANQISFKLEKGDRVAITGSNKEGRDAIMKILKGELTPTGGHINHLQGKNVVVFSPSMTKKDQARSVSDFLAQLSSSPESIKESLNGLSLNDLRVARTLNTLTSSNIFRLQLLSLQYKRPDVLLVDTSLENLSHDDLQLFSKFLTTNSMNSTIVINSDDEQFVQKVANNIIDVESLDIPTTQSHDNLASAQSKKQLKRKMVEEATAAGIREEIKQQAIHDANPATIEALNTIGFQNAAQAVSQEEYIRVMVICMILHPPIAIALYCGGFFDAIL